MTKFSNPFCGLLASHQLYSNMGKARLTKPISCYFIMNGLVFEIMSPRLPFYIPCFPLVMSSSPPNTPKSRNGGSTCRKKLFYFSPNIQKLWLPKWKFLFCRMNYKCDFCSCNSLHYFLPKECEDTNLIGENRKELSQLSPSGLPL